jgi:hypothetical protein
MPSYLKIDVSKIGKNLGTCYPKSEKPTLNPEIAYFIKSVLEVKKVIEFLTDCGIKIDLDDLGRDEELNRILEISNTRNAANQLVDKLQ